MGRPKEKNRVVKTICLEREIVDWINNQGVAFNFSDFVNMACLNIICLHKPMEREIEMQKEADRKREQKRLELIDVLNEFKAYNIEQRELANRVYLRLKHEGKIVAGDYSLAALELEWREIQVEKAKAGGLNGATECV